MTLLGLCGAVGWEEELARVDGAVWVDGEGDGEGPRRGVAYLQDHGETELAPDAQLLDLWRLKNLRIWV